MLSLLETGYNKHQTIDSRICHIPLILIMVLLYLVGYFGKSCAFDVVINTSPSLNEDEIVRDDPYPGDSRACMRCVACIGTSLHRVTCFRYRWIT